MRLLLKSVTSPGGRADESVHVHTVSGCPVTPSASSGTAYLFPTDAGELVLQMPDDSCKTFSSIALLQGTVFTGARMNWDTVSAVSMGTSGTASLVADSSGTSVIQWTGRINVNINDSGVSGLDTGAAVGDTTYYTFAIGGGGNPVAGLISLSPTAPTLPGSYTIFRRVGFIVTNASVEILKFFQTGTSRDRLYHYDEERTVVAPLLGGTDTTFTDVPLAPFVPVTAQHVFMAVGLDTQNQSDVVNIRSNGSTVTNTIGFVKPGVSTGGSNELTNHLSITVPDQIFEYALTLGGGPGTSVNFYVQGCVDEV